MTSSTQSFPGTLIATVGSNPLPILVGVLCLRPTTLSLVYTAEVEEVVNRLLAVLKEHSKPAEIQQVILRDHHSAMSIEEQLRKTLGSSVAEMGLFYTGGTKQMAVHAHAFWRTHGGHPKNGVYLAPDGSLRFDQPGSEPLDTDDVRLSLEQLVRLHFGDAPMKSSNEHNDQPNRLALAKGLQTLVAKRGGAELQNLGLPLEGREFFLREDNGDRPSPGKRLFGHFRAANEKNFKDDAPLATHLLDRLYAALGPVMDASAGTIDIAAAQLYGELPSKSKRRTEKRLETAKWLEGKWVEVWLADLLTRLKDENGQRLFHEVHQNVEVGTSADDFEMDVVAVRGYRTYVFSCTMGRGSSVVKTKLFEAAHRTARIGGDHARAAMVSMSSAPHTVLKTVKEERWAGYDRLRLFGEAHVRGQKAPCNVTQRGEGPEVTLSVGIQRWVLE